MKRKLRVAILFGGKSAEHEVSLQSARSIIHSIDKDKYEPVLIGIDKQGRWLLNEQTNFLLNEENPKLISLNKSTKELAVLPGDKEKQLVEITGGSIDLVDVVFPVLHGTLGEDGAMQGMLKLMDVAFVGADILGSAIGMDKEIMKRLLRDAGIPIGRFLVARHKNEVTFSDAEKALGLPLFIKPANQGSSVGVHKVHNEEEFEKAVADAFLYDTKILFEEFIDGREIETSVLGNENPIASVAGEILLHNEFYSYETKYIDDHGADLKIPADLSKEVADAVRERALKTFSVLQCTGMARVDSFVTKENMVIVNEINTIPGFTKISMYPKLWEASGVSYTDLIDKLITLAIERHEKNKTLKTTF